MKRFVCFFLVFAVCLGLLPGCGVSSTGASACAAFLDAVSSGDYEAAYEFLSVTVKNETEEEHPGQITKETFVQRYTAIFEALGVESIDYQITKESSGEILAQISYTLTYHTSLAGDLSFDFQMCVIRENGSWWVEWKPALIFPTMEWGDAVRIVPDTAVRGEILSDGVALAQNVNAVSISVTPSKVTDMERLVSRLAGLLGMTTAAVEKKIQAAYNDFAIVKQMYPDELDAFTKEQLLLLDGVGVDTRNYGVLRNYPETTLFAHTLGYVRSADESDLEYIQERWPELASLYTTDSKVGQLGLERVYEGELRGNDGFRVIIADSEGAVRTTLYENPAQDGADLQLTINYNLQKRTETILELLLYGEEMSGAVVVMDPTTGAVQALASYPSYNLNSFARGISSEDYNALLNLANKPLINRATQGLYPPGSTYKPFTAAAALEGGVMSADDREVLDVEIEDDKWLPTEFGPWVWSSITRAKMNHRTEPLNMHNAMINSDNIYFAYAALTMGKETFLSFSDRMGLNESIPFDLSIAKPQVYNDEEPADSSDPSSGFNLMLLADSGYGQGEMLVTPLQLASMYCLFANGGNIVTPYIVEGLYRTVDGDYTCVKKTQPAYWRTNVIRQDIIDTLNVMLEHVMSKDYNGTGHQLKVTSCTVRGKTGTAEIGNDKSREISWFVGYRSGAEGEQSPRLVLVMLEVPVGAAYSSLKFDVARELLKMSAP